MKVKIKKLHPNAVVPKYALEGDAGLDLTATSAEFKVGKGYYEYGTGLAFEIPKGHVGLLFPRSSVSKTSLSLCNSVGVVDQNFRGEVKLRFNKQHLDAGRPTYEVGDRIGQLLIIPYDTIECEEVDELSNTNRETGGFGSTGV